MSEQIYWYTARASGIVALVLVTTSVVWGLLFSTRLLQGRPSPKWLLALHRYLGGLAVVFTAVHVAGLVADSYIEFGPSEILVPFASEWQPEAVAWGVVAMYLLGAVELTSLLQNRLPRRVWRWVHVSSYLVFWMSIIHGLTAGSDAGTRAYIVGSRIAVLLVVFLSTYRVMTKRQVRRTARRQTMPRGRRVVERVAADQRDVGATPRLDSSNPEPPQRVLQTR